MDDFETRKRNEENTKSTKLTSNKKDKITKCQYHTQKSYTVWLKVDSYQYFYQPSYTKPPSSGWSTFRRRDRWGWRRRAWRRCLHRPSPRPRTCTSPGCRRRRGLPDGSVGEARKDSVRRSLGYEKGRKELIDDVTVFYQTEGCMMWSSRVRNSYSSDIINICHSQLKKSFFFIRVIQ